MKYRYKHSNIQYDEIGNIKSYDVVKEPIVKNSVSDNVLKYNKTLKGLKKSVQCRINAAVYFWTCGIAGTCMLIFPSIWGSVICYVCGGIGFIYWKILQYKYSS